MGDTREMAAAFEEVLKTGDFAQMGRLLQSYGTEDFVEEWPQSGERLTREASVRMGEMYQEKSGTSPRFTYNEVRDGKVVRMTEYFANPFEAPAWRADFVERMDAVTA